MCACMCDGGTVSKWKQTLCNSADKSSRIALHGLYWATMHVQTMDSIGVRLTCNLSLQKVWILYVTLRYTSQKSINSKNVSQCQHCKVDRQQEIPVCLSHLAMKKMAQRESVPKDRTWANLQIWKKKQKKQKPSLPSQKNTKLCW